MIEVFNLLRGSECLLNVRFLQCPSQKRMLRPRKCKIVKLFFESSWIACGFIYVYRDLVYDNE